MTDCGKFRKMTSDYIDGILCDEDSSAFEEHISCCEQCHEQYDIIKSMQTDLAKLEEPLPHGFSKRMHTTLVNAQLSDVGDKSDRNGFSFYQRYTRFAAVAAAVMVFAAVGKYGVYDVYKNVVSETNSISEQYKEQSDTNAVTEIISPGAGSEAASVKAKEEKHAPDASKKTAPVKSDAFAKAQEQTKELTPENTNEQQNAAYTHTETEINPQTADADFGDDNTSQEKLLTKSRIAVAEQTDANGIAVAQLPEDTAQPLQENISDVVDTEITSSGSGGADVSSAKQEEIFDEDILTEADTTAETAQTTVSKDKELSFAPTIVEINKSGDGSMLVFKKYLYTFLDSSEIKENGDDITITVSADDFTSVIEKISVNEYVKSITVGTNANGEAVIIIH